MAELPEVEEYADPGNIYAMDDERVFVDKDAADAAIEALKEEVERLREEAVSLLDAIFQTIDPEDGDKIVVEAFHIGGPDWVLAWYKEHPTEAEANRAARFEEEHHD